MLRVLGLVTVADAPGKPPAQIRKLMKLVAAAAPAAWHLPWVEQWRSAHLQELPVWHPSDRPAAPASKREVVPRLPPEHLSCVTAIYALVLARPAGPTGTSS